VVAAPQNEPSGAVHTRGCAEPPVQYVPAAQRPQTQPVAPMAVAAVPAPHAVQAPLHAALVHVVVPQKTPAAQGSGAAVPAVQ
jgi:hypothetical protein